MRREDDIGHQTSDSCFLFFSFFILSRHSIPRSPFNPLTV